MRRGSLWSALEVCQEDNESAKLKDKCELEHQSSGSSDEPPGPPIHQCPSIEDKKLQKQLEQQKFRMKSNKVGVGDVVMDASMVKEVKEAEFKNSPVPACPSAKFRVASGLSQFQEVDFSEPIHGGEGTVGFTPGYAVAEHQAEKSMRIFGGYDGPGCSTGESSDDEGESTGAKPKRRTQASKEIIQPQGEGNNTGNAVSFDTKNGEGSSSNEGRKKGEMRIVREKSAIKREAGAIGNIGVVSSVLRGDYRRSWNNSESMVSDDFHHISRASTSKEGTSQEYGVSRDNSFTDATDLSSASTRDATTVTIEDVNSPTSSARPPLHAPPNDAPKPFVTPTSLAIYSQIHQNGMTKSGTYILGTTAVCTFIITIVLTILILVAPKTFSPKEEISYHKPIDNTTTRPAPSLAALSMNYTAGRSLHLFDIKKFKGSSTPSSKINLTGVTKTIGSAKKVSSMLDSDINLTSSVKTTASEKTMSFVGVTEFNFTRVVKTTESPSNMPFITTTHFNLTRVAKSADSTNNMPSMAATNFNLTSIIETIGSANTASNAITDFSITNLTSVVKSIDSANMASNASTDFSLTTVVETTVDSANDIQSSATTEPNLTSDSSSTTNVTKVPSSATTHPKLTSVIKTPASANKMISIGTTDLSDKSVIRTVASMTKVRSTAAASFNPSSAVRTTATAAEVVPFHSTTQKPSSNFREIDS